MSLKVLSLVLVEIDTVYFLARGKEKPLYFLQPAYPLHIICLSHLEQRRAANRWRRDAS